MFQCVSHACPIDICPPVLFLSFFALCLAAFPQLLAFPHLHLQRRKKLKMMWKGLKLVGGKVNGKGGGADPSGAMVRPGWSEGGARVKQRSSKGSKGSMKGEKVAQTWYQKRCIFIHIVCISHRFEFATPYLFQFSTAAFSSLPLVPVPRRMLGAERVERSQKRWKNGEG